MPSPNNNIIKYNQGEKSLESLYTLIWNAC